MPKGIYERTEDTKRKMKGHPNRNTELKGCFTKGHKGFTFWKGKKLPHRTSSMGKKSTETKTKISITKTGKHLSEEHRRTLSISHGGTGISLATNKRCYHLKDNRYKKWRNAVFKRDNWTCQTCGARGYVEPHHINGWTKFPEQRYIVNNGVALCKVCHILTRRKSYV
jgi:hypothetical protein